MWCPPCLVNDTTSTPIQIINVTESASGGTALVVFYMTDLPTDTVVLAPQVTAALNAVRAERVMAVTGYQVSKYIRSQLMSQWQLNCSIHLRTCEYTYMFLNWGYS